MHSILVSACLLGQAVRYDGSDRRCAHPILQRWLNEGRVVALCPELLGGLPVPRPPVEIAGGANGRAVLAGIARVVDASGDDYAPQFVAGARLLLEQVRVERIRVALLKEGSPSCGSSFIHDGTFCAKRVPGFGVATALLRENGIDVYSEDQLVDADARLRSLDAASATEGRFR